MKTDTGKNFRSLALKYRPSRFEDVAGQEAAARVLMSAVSSGQVHSAYLFYGSRGSGKTSIARILAKALNCSTRFKSAQKGDGEPCGSCVSCKDIAIGRSLDVLEIDAASHTGVDNVREVILDTINLSPARDPYRVFIIDEVHMLSGSAFNAMLKTLEEPPRNVVFILATTEFSKVPATVVSRTHSFLFRPLSLLVIKNRLEEIARAEKIQADSDVFEEIARASGGSLRDAIGLLEQLSGLAEGKGVPVGRAMVVELLGLVKEDMLNALLEALVVDPNLEKLKNLVEECLYRIGYSPAQLIGSLYSQCAQAIIKALSDPNSEILAHRLYALERHLVQLLQDIRWSPDPLMGCEVGIFGFLLESQILPKTNSGGGLLLEPSAAAVPSSTGSAITAGSVQDNSIKIEPPLPTSFDWTLEAQKFLEQAQKEPFKLYFKGCLVRSGNPAVLEFSNLFNLRGSEKYQSQILILWKSFFGEIPVVFEMKEQPPDASKEALGVEAAANIPSDIQEAAEFFGGKIRRHQKSP